MKSSGLITSLMNLKDYLHSCVAPAAKHGLVCSIDLA